MLSTDSTIMTTDPREHMESPGTCENAISLNLFMHYSLIPSVLIVGLLSVLQRRHQKLAIDHRLPFLRGRFAVVVPLDTMGFSDRLAFGFAYGAVSYKILLLIVEQKMPISVPYWARAIAYLIGGFEVGLAYFPFFACLSTPVKIPGAVMGIIYSICWIIVIVWDILTCKEDHEADGLFKQVWGKHQKLIYQWPWVLSHIVLLLRFIYMLIKAVRVRLQLEQKDPKELMHHHQKQHVKRLLKKIPEHSKSTTWFQRRVYEWDPYFKFPSRVIGTAVVSIFTLYTFALAHYRITLDEFEKLDEFLTSNSTTHMITPLEQLFSVMSHSLLISSLLASLNSIGYIVHVLVCYRKHLKRLWKGKKDFLPEKFHKPNSAVSVASIARYSGCQIAFTLWGFLIVHLVLWLLCLGFAYILVIPIMEGRFLTVLRNFGPYLLTFLVVYGLVMLQEVLVRIFFLQDKMFPDKQKPLALNNRKAFHCFNYFFFFYNVVNGITYCIMRLLTSLMVGTFLLSRLDRTIMLRGYERMDKGYKTWIGMIFADHYHNNPAMVCFCQLLISNTMERQTASTYSVLDNMPSDSPVDSRVRQRWALFYTLLRNPHLIPLRKQHLSASASLPLSLSPQSDIVVRAWVMGSQAKPQLSPETFTPEDC